MGEAKGFEAVRTLRWGVKQSFRTYVEATGGTIEVGGGATRAPDGSFEFPALPPSTLTLAGNGDLVGTGQFAGWVSFQTHGGMLSVRLSDPGLQTDDGAAVVTVQADGWSERLDIARLEVGTDARAAKSPIACPAVLTRDGGELLGGHYPPITALDPVVLLT